MDSDRQAKFIAGLIAFVFLFQLVPGGQADIGLVEQPRSHSTSRIIAYETGIASALLGINQSKSIVLFSHSNLSEANFSSFIRVDNNDSTFIQSKDPAIGIAPNNSIIVVWSQIYQGSFRIFISSSSNQGISFSTPMPITQIAIGNQTEPEIAVANGVIYVVWSELIPGKDPDIFLVKSINSGQSFTVPIRVDHTGSSYSIQGFPDVAARGNDVFVVWHDTRNGVLDIYGAVSHDQGQAFGPIGDIRISDDVGSTEQSRPDVAYLNDGRILVIWQDRRTGDYDVRGAVSSNGASFSPSFPISDGLINQDQSDPRLVIDSRGFASVVWRDNRLRTAYHIFETSSFDGIHYEASKRVDNAPYAISCFDPDITTSENGSVFISWSDDRTGISEVYLKGLPNLAPLVEITSPVEESARKGVFSVVCEASDPEGSPQLSVQVQVQDPLGSNLTPWTEAIAADDTWHTSINSSHFANGTQGDFRIAARSFDGLVYSSVALVNVTFDNTRPPYVDLTLTSDRVQFLPNDPMALQNVTITAEVYNIGTMNAINASVRFSWLNDSTLELIGDRILAGVSSGEQATASINWMAVQGNVTIVVEVDPSNLIEEGTKANNNVSKTIHVEPARPDLFVPPAGIVIYPGQIYAEDYVNFNALVTNQGEKLASDFDVTFKVNGTLVSTVGIDELPPHQTINVGCYWSATGGPHVLEVNADPSRSLDDADFSNNIADIAFEVIAELRPTPELTVVNGTLLISPAAPMDGEPLILSALISNLGNAPASNVNLTFYVDGEAIAYRSISVLNGSESIGISVTWIAVLGEHSAGVVIDANNSILERDKTNNAGLKLFSVTEWHQLIADLAVGPADIAMEPADPVMGNVVWINVTIHNFGTASASNFEVIGSMDGDELGNHLVNYLPGNSSLVVTFTWFANEGQHSFQVEIDPAHNVTESTAGNNTAAKVFTMTGSSDYASLFIAGMFIAAAFGVMALYLLRLRKK